MKKVKIDFNYQAEQTFKIEIEAKISAFKTLLSHLEQFIDTIDLEALYSNPEAYCKEAIIQEYADSYKRIQQDKLFELIGFDTRQLKVQSDIFNSIGHQFNSKTLEYTTPDFNIYAETTEQIDRYHAVNNVVEALTELRKHSNIHAGSLIQAMNGAVIPNYKTMFVQVNTNFILSKGLSRGM